MIKMSDECMKCPYFLFFQDIQYNLTANASNVFILNEIQQSVRKCLEKLKKVKKT